MSWSVAGGLALALASTVALNWGFFIQHDAARKLPPLSARRPVRSLLSLFRSKRWLVGFFMGITGWAFYVAALTLAPLSLVQAVAAGGIALLAALVGRLTRRERAAVAIAVAGLVLLGLSLIGTGAPTAHGSWPTVTTWIVASAVLAGLAAGPLAGALAGGAGLGIAAGVLYAAGDVGTKAAVVGGARLVFIAPILACHGLAFATLNLGFQRGSALATAGMATLWMNALPIAAGSALFAESLPHGVRGAARVAAFVCVVVGAAALSRPMSDNAAAELRPAV